MDLQGEHIAIDLEGGSMPAFLCRPSEGERFPGIIVIHEIFGLTPHIEDVARRLAGQGYLTLAPELFWKIGPPPDFSDRESFMRFRQSIDDQQMLSYMDAAVARLREETDADVAHVGIVGFCFGGYCSFLEAARNPSLAACVDFYGAPVQRLLGPAAEMRVPVLALFGAEDQSIPPDMVEELRHVLERTGTPFDIVVYPGAGHAFFNDTRPTYREDAARDAWPKMLAFFGEHLKG